MKAKKNINNVPKSLYKSPEDKAKFFARYTLHGLSKTFEDDPDNKAFAFLCLQEVLLEVLSKSYGMSRDQIHKFVDSRMDKILELEGIKDASPSSSNLPKSA